MVRLTKKDQIWKIYKLIDIVYMPAKHFKEKIDCYFTKSIYQAYRGTCSFNKKLNIERTNVYQCYACSDFFPGKARFDLHVKTCSKIPGIIYKFENQSLIIYEGNLKFIGDLLFSA